MVKHLLIGLLLVSTLTVMGQSYRVELKDLRASWKVKEDQWVSADQRTEYTTIYFSVDAVAHTGSYLEIKGVAPFSVWCGGALLGAYDKRVSLSIDSLGRQYTEALRFSVHAREGLPFIQTHLVRYSPEPVVEELRLREKSHFQNFTILAVITLGLYFVVLYQSNPRSVMDYFNFSKLFSFQERDENMVAGRIASSINLVVYLFAGLWLAFLLQVLFHYTKETWVVANILSFKSLAAGLFNWVWLAVIVTGTLFLKILLSYLVTFVFNFREGFVILILNFFRGIFLILLLLSLVLTAYFIAGNVSPDNYTLLIQLIGWLLVGWVVLIFIKLMNKASFSGFHLFSYLCATEIFPIVILYEVLFY